MNEVAGLRVARRRARARPPWQGVLLGAVSALAAVAWLIVVAGHLTDHFLLDQAAGVIAALGRYAAHGTLYPPLHADGHYGGTRYMPVFMVLHGGLAHVTGEYLVSGKLLGAAAMSAVLAGVYLATRRLGCPPGMSVALAALLLVTVPVYQVSMNLHTDGLAVALQLATLLLVWPTPSPGRVTAGGVLAALALFTKFTALWGVVAGGWWLWRNRREHLVRFVVSFGVAVVVLTGLTLALSGGRVVQNLTQLGAPGLLSSTSVHNFAHDAREVLRAAGRLSQVLLLVGGVAVVALVVRRDHTTPIVPAAVVTAIMTTIVLTDKGAWINHLVDAETLSVLAVAAVIGRASWREPARAVMAVGLAAVVLLGGVSRTARDASRAVRENGFGRSAQFDPHPLGRRDPPAADLLSEDPYVPVSAGRNPVVLDPYMFVFLGNRHPQWRRELIDRIDARRFSMILLSRRNLHDSWYKDYFGPQVMDAIGRNYHYVSRLGDQNLFEPR